MHLLYLYSSARITIIGHRTPTITAIARLVVHLCPRNELYIDLGKKEEEEDDSWDPRATTSP